MVRRSQHAPMHDAVRAESARGGGRLDAGWERVKAMIRNRGARTPSNGINAVDRSRRREELVEQIQKMAREELRARDADLDRRQ